MTPANKANPEKSRLLPLPFTYIIIVDCMYMYMYKRKRQEYRCFVFFVPAVAGPSPPPGEEK